MPIFLPRHLIEERSPIRVAPVIGVYFGLGELTGQTAKPADLIQSLATLRRSDVIRLTAAIAQWVSDDSVIEPSHQMMIVNSMLTDELREKLRREIADPNVGVWCVFHRRQLLLLIQFAMIACKETAPEVSEEVLRHRIGECCLMASDILLQIEKIDTVGDGPEEANRWMTQLVISLLDSRNTIEVLARAQRFWFDLPAEPSIQSRFAQLGAVDFNSAFELKYGVALREFLLIVYSTYLSFRAHSSANTSPLLLDESLYLHPMFGEKNVRRVLSHISQSPDELAISLFGVPRQNWVLDYTPIREYPVVQVFDGKYACADLNLLNRCVTDKIYFLLQKAYPDNVFGQLFGYIFEAYIHDVIRHFSYAGEKLARTFYPGPQFSGTHDEAGDGILVWPQTVLVMEYKSRLLTTRERYSGAMDILHGGVEDIIGKESRKNKKGVYQLAAVIERLLAGQCVYSDNAKPLCLDQCKRIHPVLVAYEETVGLESVRQQAEVKFNAALKLDDANRRRVGELLILTIEEVEILESLALKHTAESVIKSYAAYVRENPKERMGSFRSFVCTSNYNANPPPRAESAVGKWYVQTIATITADLRQREAAAVERGEMSSETTAA